MTTFVQLHLLTAYPPSNLNRDDTGRPKTAVMGGATRLRVSSQALKRAWRTSPVMEAALEGRLGTRTKRLGELLEKHLLLSGVAEDLAAKVARATAGAFGALKAEKEAPLHIEQLAHLTPAEIENAKAFALEAAGQGRVPEEKEARKALLLSDGSAADVALFGRMLAATPEHNVEAAVQVAHAITVHAASVEDDYYTAVDDLKLPGEDAGAAHIGETGFGAGLFYLYLCIDADLLVRNLRGDRELARRSAMALAEAAATIGPRGKVASFASFARAHYLLAERGDRQPRSLAAAFLKPVSGTDQGAAAVKALEGLRDAFDATYGACARDRAVMDVFGGRGALAEVAAFVAASFDEAPADA